MFAEQRDRQNWESQPLDADFAQQCLDHITRQAVEYRFSQLSGDEHRVINGVVPTGDSVASLQRALLHRLQWTVPELQNQLTIALDSVRLSPRQIQILKLRVFVPKDGRPTLEELRPIMGNVTSKRVYQIEKSAETKLQRVGSEKNVGTSPNVVESLSGIISRNWTYLLEETMKTNSIADPGEPPIELWDVVKTLAELGNEDPEGLGAVLSRTIVPEQDKLTFLKHTIMPLISFYKRGNESTLKAGATGLLEEWHGREGALVPALAVLYRFPMKPKKRSITGTPISTEDLSPRIFRRLKQYVTWEELLNSIKTVDDLLKIRNFGAKSLLVVFAMLKKKFPDAELTKSIRESNLPTPRIEKTSDSEKRRVLSRKDLEIDHIRHLLRNPAKHAFDRAAEPYRKKPQKTEHLFLIITRAVNKLIDDGVLTENEALIAKKRYSDEVTRAKDMREQNKSHPDICKILDSIRHKVAQRVEESMEEFFNA